MYTELTARNVKMILSGAFGMGILFLIFRDPERAIEGAVLITAVIWLFLSLRSFPEIYMYLLILGVTNVFGIFNILQDWRIAGVRKLNDFTVFVTDPLVTEVLGSAGRASF